MHFWIMHLMGFTSHLDQGRCAAAGFCPAHILSAGHGSCEGKLGRCLREMEQEHELCLQKEPS